VHAPRTLSARACCARPLTQLPQLPWFLTATTAPAAAQSTLPAPSAGVGKGAVLGLGCAGEREGERAAEREGERDGVGEGEAEGAPLALAAAPGEAEAGAEAGAAEAGADEAPGATKKGERLALGASGKAEGEAEAGAAEGEGKSTGAKGERGERGGSCQPVEKAAPRPARADQ